MRGMCQALCSSFYTFHLIFTTTLRGSRCYVSLAGKITGKGLVRRNVFMRENRKGARPGWEEGEGLGEPPDHAQPPLRGTRTGVQVCWTTEQSLEGSRNCQGILQPKLAVTRVLVSPEPMCLGVPAVPSLVESRRETWPQCRCSNGLRGPAAGALGWLCWNWRHLLITNNY